jgi:hypothetical protein
MTLALDGAANFSSPAIKKQIKPRNVERQKSSRFVTPD